MSDLSTAMSAAILAETNKANEIAERVAKSRATTSGKVVSEMRDNTPETELPAEIAPAILKFREQIAKLDATREKMVAQANELVTANLPNVEVLSDDVLADLKKSYSEHRSTRKEAVKFALSLKALSQEDVDALPALKTFSGGSASAGNAGTGSTKPRFETITCNGKNVEAEVNGKIARTLTVLATQINAEHKGEDGFAKVTSAELVAALAASAGTQDFSTVTDITLGKFRGQYDIVAHPKQSA